MQSGRQALEDTLAEEDVGERTGDRAGTDGPATLEQPVSRVLDVAPEGDVAPSLAHITRERTLGPSPFETMRGEELERTRAFLRVAIILCFPVAAASFFAGGDPVARSVLLVGMGATVLVSLWLLAVMGRDGGYTVRRQLIAAYTCVLGAFTGIYFFGVYSPAPIVLPFGLFFFSLSQSFRATLSVYVTCAFGLLALYVATGMGLLEDRGVVQLEEASTFDRAVIMILVQAVLFATYVIGRASRAATLRAVEQHDRTVRRLVQRQALLVEARQQLEQALHAGGMGRYTDQILGSYQLGHVLGRGAMGEVYEAVHTRDGSPAAVKVLLVDMLGNTQALRRFVREAQAAASVDDEHVARVLEFGGLDAPLPYIAMERLEGVDLAEHLRHEPRLSVEDTVRLVRDVASGLRAAHAAGIVHRDLKPGNLFFARAGEHRRVWKILDFGISKVTGGSHRTLTRDNAVLGTPEFMAPEQATGRPVTVRTDVYALGVICYRALTGTPAFADDVVVRVLYAVTHQMPPRPTELVPALSPDVDAVLLIAMAKDPKDRFESAAELCDALAAAAEGRLGDDLQMRAEKLLAKHPWDTTRSLGRLRT